MLFFFDTLQSLNAFSRIALAFVERERSLFFSYQLFFVDLLSRVLHPSLYRVDVSLVTGRCTASLRIS